jgi:hypothetical protein
MKNGILILQATLCLGGSALADAKLPTIVAEGLAAYQKSGGPAAITAWLKGSPLEDDSTSTIHINELLGQIETDYGKMIGFDLVRIVTVSPAVQRVYLVLKFERGPVYASFDCYKTGAGWIIATMDANTKANAVFPPRFLDGSGQ